MIKRTLDLDLYAVADHQGDRAWMDVMANQGLTPVGTDTSLPRVTLVVGPSPFSMPRGWEFFLCSPSEGVSYIATVLHNAGYPVRIVDVRYTPDPLGDAYRQVMEGTDVLGIATFEDNYPFVEDLIAACKEARPKMPIILGGSLVTSVPHVFMRETAADIAVISEGELTILEVLDAYVQGVWDERLPQIRGIWWRGKDGVAHKNPPRGQMPNLDSLPIMNLSLWPQSSGPGGLQPQIISSYSRGCKMDCSFCYRTTPQDRVKSPQRLRAELAHFKKHYGIEFIFFVDLTFTSHKKQTLEYLEVIKEFDLGWTCLTRNADVDPEICAAMKGAGCSIALYGVESLSPQVLKEARKGSSENIVLRAMRYNDEAGVPYGGLTIVGLPGETEESLDHMCRWAEENNHITRVKYLSAMPGTAVYQQALREGHIKSEVQHLRWLAVEQALERDEYLNYNDLPETVMRQAYKRLYDSYRPGPVMDFKHFPEHFNYYDPDPNPNKPWRAKFSSAGAPDYPGAQQYRGLLPAATGTTLSFRPGEVLMHA